MLLVIVFNLYVSIIHYDIYHKTYFGFEYLKYLSLFFSSLRYNFMTRKSKDFQMFTVNVSFPKYDKLSSDKIPIH